MLAGPLHSPHLVTSGLDCTWITTEEECAEVTSEVHYIYVGAEDIPNVARGCLTTLYQHTRISVFNRNSTNIDCGTEIPDAGNKTIDCVCKGKGMTALPIGNATAKALFLAQQGGYLCLFEPKPNEWA